MKRLNLATFQKDEKMKRWNSGTFRKMKRWNLVTFQKDEKMKRWNSRTFQKEKRWKVGYKKRWNRLSSNPVCSCSISKQLQFRPSGFWNGHPQDFSVWRLFTQLNYQTVTQHTLTNRIVWSSVPIISRRVRLAPRLSPKIIFVRHAKLFLMVVLCFPARHLAALHVVEATVPSVFQDITLQYHQDLGLDCPLIWELRKSLEIWCQWEPVGWEFINYMSTVSLLGHSQD